MIKKIFLGGVVAVVLIVGIAAHYLLSNLDHLVVAAVEKYGSEATGTKVRLHGAKIKLTDGEGALEGLSVANPSGFSASDAVTVGLIDVRIDPASVTKTDGPIVIKEVDVDAPAIDYEMTSGGGNNLNTLKANAAAHAPQDKNGGSGGDQGKQGRKVIISDLYIRKGMIQISHPLLQGKTISAPLPTIHLHDVGKASNGATEKEVAQQIAEAVTHEAMTAASKAANGALGAALSAAANGAADVKGKANDMMNSVKANGTVNSLTSKLPFGK
jgi:hypothetical protein